MHLITFSILPTLIPTYTLCLRLSVHLLALSSSLSIRPSVVHGFFHAPIALRFSQFVALLLLSISHFAYCILQMCSHFGLCLHIYDLPTPWILQVGGMPLNEAVQQLRRPTFFKSINITPLCLMIVPSLADQCTTRFIHFDPRI